MLWQRLGWSKMAAEWYNIMPERGLNATQSSMQSTGASMVLRAEALCASLCADYNWIISAEMKTFFDVLYRCNSSPFYVSMKAMDVFIVSVSCIRINLPDFIKNIYDAQQFYGVDGNRFFNKFLYNSSTKINHK